MIGCVHSRNNVGSYLMGVAYDAEEKLIVVHTSSHRYVLHTGHIKDVAARELVDLLESMRLACVRSEQDGLAVGGNYDWVVAPQVNPPAKEPHAW
jgi:hypothetical protein